MCGGQAHASQLYCSSSHRKVSWEGASSDNEYRNELTINLNYDLLYGYWGCSLPRILSESDFNSRWKESRRFGLDNALFYDSKLTNLYWEIAIGEVIGSCLNQRHPFGLWLKDFEFEKEPTVLKESNKLEFANSKKLSWRKCNNKSHWKHSIQLIASVWPAGNIGSAFGFSFKKFRFSSEWTVRRDGGVCYGSWMKPKHFPSASQNSSP